MKIIEKIRHYFSTETPDDRRNFGWRLWEALAIKPIWSRTVIDLRLGFKRDGKWKCYLGVWEPTRQNFWNGIFTFQFYVTGSSWFVWPRVGYVIRYRKTRWHEAQIGWLFDRGEFQVKWVFMNEKEESPFSPGDARGWEEGSV